MSAAAGSPSGRAAGPARVLVVEDEPHIAEGLVLNLEAEGYAVELCRQGYTGLERARGGGFDLIVLDVMLPGLSGFEIVEELRRGGSRVPVLFLTARARHEDRVLGLDAGGDDYLVKPFRLDELLSRVRALLRRQAWYREDTLAEPAFRFGANEVDFKTGACRTARGDDRLTEKELAILRVLVERRGEPVSREELVTRCWGPEEMPTPRTIDNFLLRLRRRFEEDPQAPRHLLTAFGKGYRFEP